MQQTSSAIDLDAYFQRIGYEDQNSLRRESNPPPTLTTLQKIHYYHTQTIAFENLSPLLNQPVHLDLESLQEKLISQKRGGYCFEQNLLLRSVLCALGFQVKNLAARVIWNQPDGTITPRSHMLLQIDIDGKPYIADVGFGGLTLSTPLLLQPGIEQPTPHEVFRLLQTNQTYVMQALVAQEWKSLYRFDLQEQQIPDYEVSNWYVSTYPNSMFVNTLLAGRPAPDRRYALRDNQFTTYYLDERREQTILTTVTELKAVLEEIFLLQLPNHPNLDSVLQKLVEKS